MAIFNSYVKLPEGIYISMKNQQFWKIPNSSSLLQRYWQLAVSQSSHSILMECSGYRLEGQYQQLGIQGFTRPPINPFFRYCPQLEMFLFGTPLYTYYTIIQSLPYSKLT